MQQAAVQELRVQGRLVSESQTLYLAETLKPVCRQAGKFRVTILFRQPW